MSDFKPWEETWYTDTVGGIYIEGLDEVALFEEKKGTFGERDQPRARLASTAPDMARVLLAVEWKPRTNGGWCPSCEDYEQHHPDCALDAALRKAGAR